MARTFDSQSSGNELTLKTSPSISAFADARSFASAPRATIALSLNAYSLSFAVRKRFTLDKGGKEDRGTTTDARILVPYTILRFFNCFPLGTQHDAAKQIDE